MTTIGIDRHRPTRDGRPFFLRGIYDSGFTFGGTNMAGHLAAKGHQVTVYNRTPAKAQARQETLLRPFPSGSPPRGRKRARVGACARSSDLLTHG